MLDYSIIVPAYNEQSYLGKTLTQLSSAMANLEHRGELIVVDNNSSDETAKVARGCGARVVFEAKNQISKARNTGAKAAGGKFLIFVDADTIVPDDLLNAAVEDLFSGKCLGGGALISFDNPVNVLARAMLWSWNMISATFKLAAGSFLYCLKEGFDEVGGFSEEVYAAEELFFVHSLKRWGKKQSLSFKIITEPKVTTSGRKIETHSILELLLLIPLFLVFPIAVRSKRLCRFWYERRDEKLS